MSRGETTVLVVDDEAAIRLLCRVNLELDGYRVLEAASLDQARSALRDEPVSVVLLDVHVGTERGTTLLDELRAQGSDVPVALMTGAAEAQTSPTDADLVILKPFPPEALANAVRELVTSRVEPQVDSRA